MNAEMSHSRWQIHEHKDPPLKDLPLSLGNLPRYVLLLPIRFYQNPISHTLPEKSV